MSPPEIHVNRCCFYPTPAGARQLLSSPAWPEKVNGGIPESLVVCLRSGGLDNRVRREGDHPWMGNWLNFMQN